MLWAYYDFFWRLIFHVEEHHRCNLSGTTRKYLVFMSLWKKIRKITNWNVILVFSNAWLRCLRFILVKRNASFNDLRNTATVRKQEELLITFLNILCHFSSFLCFENPQRTLPFNSSLNVGRFSQRWSSWLSKQGKYTNFIISRFNQRKENIKSEKQGKRFIKTNKNIRPKKCKNNRRLLFIICQHKACTCFRFTIMRFTITFTF